MQESTGELTITKDISQLLVVFWNIVLRGNSEDEDFSMNAIFFRGSKSVMTEAVRHVSGVHCTR